LEGLMVRRGLGDSRSGRAPRKTSDALGPSAKLIKIWIIQIKDKYVRSRELQKVQ
jgi:hypothetical protein